ncbi:MAG: hypothetical protein IKD96_00395 [Oscillospiraceae bacterium]|nr:hypothetical protein [Oscillospiraceae bacterium]
MRLIERDFYLNKLKDVKASLLLSIRINRWLVLFHHKVDVVLLRSNHSISNPRTLLLED